MSKKKEVKKIEKPFASHINDLLQALLLIRDSLELIRNGKEHHYATLTGQLRAILIDHAKDNIKLLFYVAENTGIDLNVYFMGNVTKMPEELRNKIDLHLTGFPVTLYKKHQRQELISLESFLDQELLFFDNQKYTPKEIIKWLAHNTGGAHYSKRIPKHFLEIMSFKFLQLKPLQNALYQIGQVVLELGHHIISKLCDFEMHGIYFFPKQDFREDQCIMDLQYPQTSMRITLLMNVSKNLVIQVQSLKGEVFYIFSKTTISNDKPVYLNLNMRITSKLTTVLEMNIDGYRVSEGELDRPLFVLSDIKNYNTTHNKLAEGSPQDFSLAIAEFTMIGRHIDPIERAQMLIYFTSKLGNKDKGYIVYNRFSYGSSEPGTNTISMTGKVERKKLSEITN